MNEVGRIESRMENHQSKVLLTRKTWAAYMLPAVLLAAVVGGVTAWFTGELRFATAPLGLLGVWAMLHFRTPREGRSYPTIHGTPGAPTLLWFCGATLLLTGALTAVDTYLLGHPINEPVELYHAALFLPPFVLLFVGAYYSDRKKDREQGESNDST